VETVKLTEPDGLIHHYCRVATGLTLHVVERPGEGAPVLLLHGVWGMWRSWNSMLSAEAPVRFSRPLLAVDLRGHGFSEKPETGYALEDYAADVIALIDQMPHQRVTLIGHSLGALVSLAVVSSIPERIDSVVLEEPTLPIPAGVDNLEGFWEDFVEALFGLYLLKHEPRDIIVAELMRAAEGISSEAAEEGAFSIAQTADGVFSALMEGEISPSSIDRCVGRPIVTPTLVFQGAIEEERALSDAGVAMLRQVLANPTLVIVPETGHTVHSVRPEEFQRLVVDFLAD
jgi:pimeloyl-ACP methyl ester carboxylesterase